MADLPLALDAIDRQLEVWQALSRTGSMPRKPVIVDLDELEHAVRAEVYTRIAGILGRFQTASAAKT